jgi:hypothetical protein
MKHVVAAVLAVVVAAALAPAAIADAPSPLSLTGTSVTNADGSRTLTVSGTYTWEKKCDPKKPVGYAIAWNDPTAAGNVVGNGIAVGTPSDNAIHTTNGCGNPSTFGPLSHTYPASVNATVQVCVVTYPNKDRNKTAGGPTRQTDNSVEENEDGKPMVCFTFNPPSPPPPPPVTDVCSNMESIQTSVPSGMTKDASGNCVTPTLLPSPPTTTVVERVVVRTIVKKVVVVKKVKAKTAKKVKARKAKTKVKGVRKALTPRVLPHTR